jgi:hypothetical protein
MAFLKNSCQSLETMDLTTTPLKSVNQISNQVLAIRMPANVTKSPNSLEKMPKSLHY